MDPAMSTMLNLRVLRAFMVSTITVSKILVNGARFRDVGDLLNYACTSKRSFADSFFHWMILLSSNTQLPHAMAVAVKTMNCSYEVRTIESLQGWNTSELIAAADYKVIAIGIPFEDLRRSLNVHVSNNNPKICDACKAQTGPLPS